MLHVGVLVADVFWAWVHNQVVSAFNFQQAMHAKGCCCRLLFVAHKPHSMLFWYLSRNTYLAVPFSWTLIPELVMHGGMCAALVCCCAIHAQPYDVWVAPRIVMGSHNA